MLPTFELTIYSVFCTTKVRVCFPLKQSFVFERTQTQNVLFHWCNTVDMDTVLCCIDRSSVTFFPPLEVIQQHSLELKHEHEDSSFKSLSTHTVAKALCVCCKAAWLFFTLNYISLWCPWWYCDCASNVIVEKDKRVLSIRIIMASFYNF